MNEYIKELLEHRLAEEIRVFDTSFNHEFGVEEGCDAELGHGFVTIVVDEDDIEHGGFGEYSGQISFYPSPSTRFEIGYRAEISSVDYLAAKKQSRLIYEYEEV